MCIKRRVAMVVARGGALSPFTFAVTIRVTFRVLKWRNDGARVKRLPW